MVVGDSQKRYLKYHLESPPDVDMMFKYGKIGGIATFITSATIIGSLTENPFIIFFPSLFFAMIGYCTGEETSHEYLTLNDPHQSSDIEIGITGTNIDSDFHI